MQNLSTVKIIVKFQQTILLKITLKKQIDNNTDTTKMKEKLQYYILCFSTDPYLFKSKILDDKKIMVLP